MSTSNSKLLSKLTTSNAIVNTAQVEQNTSDRRSDKCQDDSQPIRSVKSIIEQLTQQNSNNDNETKNTNIKPAVISQQQQFQTSLMKTDNGINDQQVQKKKVAKTISAFNEPNRKPSTQSSTLPSRPSETTVEAQVEQNTFDGSEKCQDDLQTIRSQQQFQVSSMRKEPLDDKIHSHQVQKMKKVAKAISAFNELSRKSSTQPSTPFSRPLEATVGGIKSKNNPNTIGGNEGNNENGDDKSKMVMYSPTLLHHPNSAPLQNPNYVLDDDDPFDDSKVADPFSDANEMDNEFSATTSSTRPRRHSHTLTSSHVTFGGIRNKNDNLTDANSNLHRSSSQSIPSKPPKRYDNLIQKCINDDLENRPSLPPRPPNKSDKQTPPPLPNRPQLPPRNPDQNNNKEKKSKRQKEASSSDSDPLLDRTYAPDAASANRRPPRFHGVKDINSKVTTRTFAISGKLVVTGSGHTRVWSLVDGVNFRTISHDDSKVTSLCWRPTRRVEDVGRYIWCGSQDGCLSAIDINGINAEKHIEINKKAHNSQINFILRHEFQLWTLDESGKLQIWSEDEDGIVSMKSKPQSVKVSPKTNCAIVVDHHLWLSSGKTIEIFNPLDISGSAVKTIELEIGSVKYMTQTNNSSLVYIGHDDGKITVWDTYTYKLKSTVPVSVYCINSLLGVGDHLWVGFKTGMIYIYDVRSNPWIVIKEWQAHKAPIVDMQLDETGLWKVDRLQVASLSGEGQIIAWDGLMHEDWIADKMTVKENRYCNYREVKVLICSWNIDASKPADLEKSAKDTQFLKDWFQSTESPDIIVVGFQEIIDLESKKMTAKTMLLTKKKADKQLNENITQRYKLWYDKLLKIIRQYTNQEYEVLVSDNLVGLFTCVFAKKSESCYIRNKDVAIKKTGLKGFHGNKGSIATRFIYDDSSICFVNCHLAAGQTQTKARNTDVANILDDTVFPLRANDSWDDEGVFIHGGDGSMVLDHEIVFFSGDLNYRIDDLQREEVLEAVENKEYSFLLKHDQLLKQRKTNPGFRLRSFSEGELKFAPTYKYDRGENDYDTSEKRRIPAWCDRILYFGKNIKQEHYSRYECKVSDHRPISGAFSLRIKTIKRDGQTNVKEEIERAWKEKVKGEKTEIMIKWIKECGWDEQSAVKALKENHGNLRTAVDELSKRIERK